MKQLAIVDQILGSFQPILDKFREFKETETLLLDCVEIGKEPLSKYHATVAWKEEILKRTPLGETMIYYGVKFHLTPELLDRVEFAQDHELKLKVLPIVATDWRNYVLFSKPQRLSIFTFLTYFQEKDQEQLCFKSVMQIDGDVINQIREDALENQETALRLVNAHYWLIAQLFDRLQQELDFLFSIIAWILSIIIVVLGSFKQWTQFDDKPWLVLYPIISSFLIQWGIKKLLEIYAPKVIKWVTEKVIKNPSPEMKKIRDSIITSLKNTIKSIKQWLKTKKKRKTNKK